MPTRKERNMSLLTDAKCLKHAAVPDVRQGIARKVSDYFCEGVFDDNETLIAGEILRLLAKDVEIRVRVTLSEQLKQNTSIPHDVAVTLANDVLEVAQPMIEHSKVLTEDDLVDIIQSTNEVAKLLCISRRETVSEQVSQELTDTQHEEVVVSLFANKGAKISYKTMEQAISHFNENGGFLKTLLNRGDLPISIAEKMIHEVSEEFATQLKEKYALSDKVATEASSNAHESATLGLFSDHDPTVGFKTSPKQEKVLESNSLSPEKKSEMVHQLVTHLHRQDRLTHSIILRSLCEGNILFFEYGIARLAGIPTMNVRTLISNPNADGFKSLCQQANMPESTVDAMYVMLKYAFKEKNDNTLDDEGFKSRLLEHIMAKGYDSSIPLMPYVMALIASNLRTTDIVS